MSNLMKNIKKNTVILMIITILVLFFVLKDNFILVFKNITNINIFWIIIALLCVLIYWLSQSLTIYMMAKEYSEKITFKTVFFQTLITQFFNGVTPFSTGGQPMAIYMLKEEDMKTSHATSVILQNFLLYQMALLFIGLIAVIINYSFNLFPNSDVLRKLITLGFVINFIVGVGIVFVSFSKRFNKEFVSKIIDFLALIRLVKNKSKTKKKWDRMLDEFHSSASLLKNDKSLFVKGFLYNLIGLIFLYITPIFILFSLKNYTSLNLINTIASSAYVFIMGAFVPIPGGSGGVEYGYLEFFKYFVPNSLLSTSLLLWRFITYYLGILIGGIALNFYKGGEEK